MNQLSAHETFVTENFLSANSFVSAREQYNFVPANSRQWLNQRFISTRERNFPTASIALPPNFPLVFTTDWNSNTTWTHLSLRHVLSHFRYLHENSLVLERRPAIEKAPPPPSDKEIDAGHARKHTSRTITRAVWGRDAVGDKLLGRRNTDRKSARLTELSLRSFALAPTFPPFGKSLGAK